METCLSNNNILSRIYNQAIHHLVEGFDFVVVHYLLPLSSSNGIDLDAYIMIDRQNLAKSPTSSSRHE